MNDELIKAVERNRKLRPRTRQLYVQHVRGFLAYLGKSKPSTEKVLAWRADMAKRKIQPQSINVALNALRFAAKAAGAKFFDARVERLPVENDDDTQTSLTWKQAQRLVAACAGNHGRDLRDRAMIVLGLRTGMLRFSICALQIEDLEVSADQPTLTFTKKGGARHKISLDATTYNALQPWISWLASQGEHRGALFRALGRQRVLEADSIEISPNLTPDGLYRILQYRGKIAKLMDLSPYIFRTTFKDWAGRFGATPPQIAMVTGHRSDAQGSLPEPGAVAANFLLPDFDALNLASDNADE